MDVRRRLERLEAARGTQKAPYEVPMSVRIYLKAVERHRAHENGEVPPAYAQEELEALHADDLETVADGSVVGLMRSSGGWESPEGRELLDGWEEGARQRLARVEEGETLEAVYEDDGEEAS